MKANRTLRAPKPSLLAGALATCLVFVAPQLMAQSSNATLRGKAPANANITAVNTATGQQRTVTSSADGSYALVGLPPGTYTVSAGAGTERTITLQVATSVNLNLSPAQAAPPAGDATTLDTVSVTASALPEVKTSEVGTNVSLKQINTVPQLTRNFLEFADTVPGMQFETNANGQSSLRGGAQKSSAINVYIDGVGQKNYVLTGGVTGQDQSRGNPFPQLAIGEYKVVTSNYKAEFDQVGSAAVIAATKSGTNEFEGEAFYRINNTDMRAKRVDEIGAGSDKKRTQQDEYGFALGGPIIEDRMFFFMSYEAKEFVQPVPPVSVPQNWSSFERFLPAGVQSQLGPATEPFNEDLYFGKLTWDVSDNDRVEFSVKVRDEEGLTGAGDRTTASAAKVNFNTEERYDLKWQHYGESFVNEARLTYEDALFNPAPYIIGNQSIYTRGLLEDDVLIFADSTSSLAIQRKGQRGPGFQNDITFNSFQWAGDHVIKAGVKYKNVELTQSENSALNPSFRYAVNDGSLAVGPFTPLGTNAIPYQVDFNAPFQGASPTVTTKSKQFGIYVQDDWDVNDRLQLNLGIRWDYEETPSYLDHVTPPEILASLFGPGTNPAVSATYVEQLAKGGIDINQYISTGNNRGADKNNFAPRLGFSYDLSGDEGLVLFGGVGRSYDRNLYDYMGLEQVKSALSSYEIRFAESSGCAVNGTTCLNWNPVFLQGIENLQALVTSNVRNGEINLMNNDLETPYSDQFSLGLRATLGEWLTSATAAYVHSKEGFVFTLGNRFPNGNFFDNRQLCNSNPDLTPEIQQPWDCRPPGFGSLIIGDNGIETKTKQLLLSAEKPYDEETGWGFTAAYTYSNARGNRGSDEHYSFDAATIGDYPFIGLKAVPRHRLVLTGIYDLGRGFTLSAKATAATPAPLNNAVGWWEYGAPQGAPVILATDAPGTLGTKQFDLSLQKDFQMSERMGLHLRADVINVFNWENYSTYRTSWGSNGVLDPQTEFVTTGNGVNSFTPPRTLYLTTRLTF